MAEGNAKNQADEDAVPLDEELEEEPMELEAEEDEEPISLVGEEEVGGESGIKAFGAAAAGGAQHQEQFQRKANADGTGAVRCRVFHSKISEAAIAHMEQVINEWIDQSEIEVKEVGHMVGPMVGKTTEPNIIVMVWY